MTPAVALLVGALMLALPGPTAAHSLLLESSPAAGAVTTGSPAAITLVFNNRVEKRLCRLRLIDGQARARPLTISADGPADRLEARAPALSPGPWQVEWVVMSADGHVVSGTFAF
ncbi:MAG TPA: copper resistance CopC family protein, partial [Methylomirabilota bacterium]|nr:copper resistance CopC family protein [Methylomirabilota bacterium]